MPLAALCALFLAAAAAAEPADAAGDAVLIDMRGADFLRPPTLADAERRTILTAARSATNGEETTINSVAHGAFTARGRDETVYLLQRGGPRAADPDAPRDVTVVVSGEGRMQVPLPTDAGNFIQSMVDIDNDGIDELLLRNDAYQMGIATTRLSLVSLAQGRVTVIASFPEARVDRCGDERFGGDVEADVIRYSSAPSGSKPEFIADRYVARCEDGAAPRAEKFRPLAASGS